MLGTETIARLLGLRVNHPQGSESLERSPNAAGVARRGRVLAREAPPASIPRGSPRSATWRRASSSRARPTWQRDVLARALRFVGYPYVFSGMSEKTQKLWSATAPGNTITVPGGFDCSGLVWRVFKLEPFPARRRSPRCCTGGRRTR